MNRNPEIEILTRVCLIITSDRTNRTGAAIENSGTLSLAMAQSAAKGENQRYATLWATPCIQANHAGP